MAKWTLISTQIKEETPYRILFGTKPLVRLYRTYYLAGAYIIVLGIFIVGFLNSFGPFAMGVAIFFLLVSLAVTTLIPVSVKLIFDRITKKAVLTSQYFLGIGKKDAKSDQTFAFDSITEVETISGRLGTAHKVVITVSEKGEILLPFGMDGRSARVAAEKILRIIHSDN